MRESPLAPRPQIQACEGIDMRPFSLFPDEAEVLFAAGAKFRVTSSQKRLEPEHLEEHAPPGGAWPPQRVIDARPCVVRHSLA